MKILLDAGFVLQHHGATVLLVLACIVWGSAMIAGFLSTSEGSSSDNAVMFALAMGGWVVPALLCSVVILPLGILLHVHPGVATVVALLAVSAGSALWSFRRAHVGQSGRSLSSLLLLVAIFLSMALLRLAFVARIALPPYFDSAEHYRIIYGLISAYLSAGTSFAWAWPVGNYYHLGYHAIIALLAVLSRANIGQLMMISGVLALAALPMPLFAIAYRETGSRSAGLLAVLLGSLGWYMPGHVVNWGKYPALFGVAVVLFTLVAAYLSQVTSTGDRPRRGLLTLTLIGACAAVAIHTRAIILLGGLLSAWLLSNLWLRCPAAQRRLIAGLVLAALVAEAVMLARNAVFAPLLDPYLAAGIWITGLVGLLSVFAFKTFPRLAFACVLALVLLCLGVFVPVPGFASGPLLDRPLLEMVLFVPLALLGAAGFAAVERDVRLHAEPLRVAAALLISSAIVVNASVRYNFYPSDCCVFVKGDDLAAFDWLQRTLLSDDRVLVPTASLRDAPLPYPPLSPASDAGAWIFPLTGRQTAALPYWTDFGDPNTLVALCEAAVSYIFVGHGPQSFGEQSLQARPGWYTMGLALTQTRIYRVTGCSG